MRVAKTVSDDVLGFLHRTCVHDTSCSFKSNEIETVGRMTETLSDGLHDTM